MNMGLVGTVSREKKVKSVKTPADVASKLASDMKKQGRETKKARITSSQEQEAEEQQEDSTVQEGDTGDEDESGDDEDFEGADDSTEDGEYDPDYDPSYGDVEDPVTEIELAEYEIEPKTLQHVVGAKRKLREKKSGGAVPVSAEMSVPLKETTLPPALLQGDPGFVRIDPDFVGKLYTANKMLTELFGDFKEGTTLLLKYDMMSERLYVHGNEGDDFVCWDNTLQFDLKHKNKVTYNVRVLMLCCFLI